MPLFFICFIVFVIWLRVKMRKTNSAISESSNAFWEREAKANFARSQDISKLDYIHVTEEDLPFTPEISTLTDEQEADLEQQVLGAS